MRLNPFLVPCADRRVDRRPAAPVGHEPGGPDLELGEDRVEEVLQGAGAAGGVDKRTGRRCESVSDG